MSANAVKQVRRLPPLQSIRDLIKLYNLSAIRQLSQNFLMDQRITDKIVRSAGSIHNHEVCEVGPGPGGITRSILYRNPRRLIVIEKDRRFLPALELLSDACPGLLEIHMGDVMSFAMDKMFSEECRKPWEDVPPNITLIGNLPFNVSTHLIIRWLNAMSLRESAWSYGRTRMLLTFQKEVAERMVAPIMSPQRCRLSVMCQNWCSVNHKFTIPGSAFVPKPEVDVGVVHFTPLVQPVINLPFKMIEAVVGTIFSGRQKYSTKGAGLLYPAPAREKLVQEMYTLADVSPTVRPYQISVEEYGRLCEAYKTICDRDPRLYKYNFRMRKSSLKEFEDDFVESSVDGG